MRMTPRRARSTLFDEIWYNRTLCSWWRPWKLCVRHVRRPTFTLSIGLRTCNEMEKQQNVINFLFNSFGVWKVNEWRTPCCDDVSAGARSIGAGDRRQHQTRSPSMEYKVYFILRVYCEAPSVSAAGMCMWRLSRSSFWPWKSDVWAANRCKQMKINLGLNCCHGNYNWVVFGVGLAYS